MTAQVNSDSLGLPTTTLNPPFLDIGAIAIISPKFKLGHYRPVCKLASGATDKHNLLDLDPDFLGEFSGRFAALGSVPDRANSLVGPVDR
jgi:hypothetical protein